MHRQSVCPADQSLDMVRVILQLQAADARGLDETPPADVLYKPQLLSVDLSNFAAKHGTWTRKHQLWHAGPAAGGGQRVGVYHLEYLHLLTAL